MTYDRRDVCAATGAPSPPRVPSVHVRISIAQRRARSASRRDDLEDRAPSHRARRAASVAVEAGSRAGSARASVGIEAQRDVRRVALQRRRDDARRSRRRGSPASTAASASRSIACASARRRSRFDVAGCAWSNARYAGPRRPARGCASAHRRPAPGRRAAACSAPSPCRARRARSGAQRVGDAVRTNSTRATLPRPSALA